jgi:hypothetical protein
MTKFGMDIFNQQLWANRIMRNFMESTMSSAMEYTRVLTPTPLRKFKGYGNDTMTFDYEGFVIEAGLMRQYTPEPDTLKSIFSGGRVRITIYVQQEGFAGTFLWSVEIAIPMELDLLYDPDFLLMTNLPAAIERAKEKLWDRLADGKSDRISINTAGSARK